MSNRSETFGRLLKGAINSIAAYEGKTAPARVYADVDVATDRSRLKRNKALHRRRARYSKLSKAPVLSMADAADDGEHKRNPSHHPT